MIYKKSHPGKFFLKRERLFWGEIGDRIWINCRGDSTLFVTTYGGITIDKHGMVILVEDKI